MPKRRRQRKPHLILASSSPRRQQLLRDHGYSFEIVTPHEHAECGICSKETPPEMVARLAWQKARDVAYRYEEGLFLAADTLTECCGHVLGKPKNREHAGEMLRLKRDRVHHVYSGICVWRRPDDDIHVVVDRSALEMRPLSDEEIEAYLDTDAWQGKAGGYGYQDGHTWVRLTEGSETNVVGLPMEKLAETLEKMDEL